MNTLGTGEKQGGLGSIGNGAENKVKQPLERGKRALIREKHALE